MEVVYIEPQGFEGLNEKHLRECLGEYFDLRRRK
jgi:hypothetical protein